MKTVTDKSNTLINSQRSNIENVKKVGSLSDITEAKALSTQTLAKDVYHKGEHIPQDKSTYDNPLSISTRKSTVSAAEVTVKAYETLYFGELPDKLGQVRSELDGILQQLEQDNPELAQKDWGFSVSPDNKLVVTGNVTQSEQKYLETTLNSNKQLVKLSSEIPEILSRGLENDRSYNGKSKYLGKYDVNQQNFQNIVDVKQLVDSTRGANAEFFDNGVDAFAYQRELTAQLAANAEVKFGY